MNIQIYIYFFVVFSSPEKVHKEEKREIMRVEKVHTFLLS